MRLTVIRAAKTASFLLLATFANPLMAQTTTDYSSGWYMGANIGLSTTDIDEEKITQNLTNPSYTDDDRDLDFKLFGGYQFNKYFALEGGYFDLGEFDYAVSTSTGTLDGNIKVKGVNLDAVAILPVTENFSAFARVGANYAHTKTSLNPTGSISVNDTGSSENNLRYKFGAGLQYAITDAIGLRLEAERYRINDTIGNNGDIDLYSVGIIYKFGVTKNVAPVSEKEEVIAPAPKEEKALIVVTEPEAQEKIKEAVTQEKIVVLIFEDIHFEFDKSTLSKEAKDALKRDISLLNKNPKTKVLVSGYASKMGTENYNQGLSERRAQSVKDYLVKEQLIAADKISTIGYGETRPIQYEAKPSNINSKAAKANMRVFLEITHK